MSSFRFDELAKTTFFRKAAKIAEKTFFNIN